MPIPQSQATLRNFFNTGDMPTEAQFADLIDTMFYYTVSLQTQIDALVVASQATTPGAANVVVSATAVASPVFTGSRGVASVTSISTGPYDQPHAVAAITFRRLRITFTTAYANTLYTAVAWSSSARLLTDLQSLGPPLVPVQVSKTTGYIDVEIESGKTLYLVCFA